LLKIPKCAVYAFLGGYTFIAHESLANQNSYDKIKFWHLRSGHVGEKGLVELPQQGLLGSEKVNKLEFWEECALFL
jgi:hypothetical protein